MWKSKKGRKHEKEEHSQYVSGIVHEVMSLFWGWKDIQKKGEIVWKDKSHELYSVEEIRDWKSQKTDLHC